MPVTPRSFLQSSLLSPFSVKARLLARAFEVPVRYTPEHGNAAVVARLQTRMTLAPLGVGHCLHRSPSALDEFPLVPWLFPETGGYLCDSTEIGLYLERQSRLPGRLTPQNPACGFAVRLIEEAVDEVALYALHHMRWVVSARTNRAMEVLTEEVAGSLGARAARLFTSRFGPRQVRRLAYLFSVAPTGDDRFRDIEPAMRPPSRPGFPPTHALLERVWDELIAAVDEALADGRAYLFGDGMTLADAAILGNLGSTIAVDPEAAARLSSQSPLVAAWVRKRLNEPLHLGDEHELSSAHTALLRWACDAFLPLMRRNAEEHARRGLGGRRNERAFDAGEKLFDGELMGSPYRTVVKDFQVKTYREIERLHAALAVDEVAQLRAVGFDWPGR